MESAAIRAPAPRFESELAVVRRWLSVAALVGALVVLLGWATGSVGLERFVRGDTTMKADDAVSVLLLAAALLLGERGRLRTAAACAATAVAIALVTLVEYVFGVDAGIDQLVVRDTADVVHPGRMAPNAAVFLLLLGGAFLLQSRSRRAALVAHVLTLAAATIALLVLVGYASGTPTLYGPGGAERVSVPAALAFTLLCGALLLSRPDVGVAGALTRPNIEGRLLRLTLVPAIVVPLSLGYARVALRRTGVDEATSAWLYAVAVIVLLLAAAGVTARVLGRASLALQETTSRLFAIVEHSPLAILTLGSAGTVTSWNPAAERMFGWSADEAIARPYPLVRPDEWAAVIETLRLVETTGPARFERTRHCRDGSDVIVDVAASPIRLPDGTFAGVSAVMADVTARRRAEEALRESEARFRALIENSLDLMTVLAPDGTIRYASPSLESILGYRPHELYGQSAFWLVHPDDVERIAEILERASRVPGVTRADEFRARDSEGSWHLMEVVGVNLLDDPAVGGMLVTWRDVTSQRELELRLRQAERLEAVGQLAGGIAHDFNNVLLVIRGYSSVLAGTLDDPQQLADVAEIARAADRAANLTRQLLAFGRRQALEPRPLLVPEIVADMESLLRRTMREDIELRIEVSGEPAPVVADPAQIEQVLMNLVVNARDAIDGRGTVTVGATELELADADPTVSPSLRGGRYLALSVTDTGSGITDETLPHIFEPFFTTKEDGLGNGLGLSTVYGIVVQSGGGIRVRTGVGRGTAFTVYLPVAERVAVEPEERPAQPIAGGGSETILVVEDEEAVRELVRRVLEGAGYTVLAAGRPSEAEALLAGAPQVDLLLTDVVMPEMSGYELAAAARRRRPGIRTLFMSGYPLAAAGSPRDRQAVLLKKPFTPAELARAVRSALSRPETGEAA